MFGHILGGELNYLPELSVGKEDSAAACLAAIRKLLEGHRSTELEFCGCRDLGSQACGGGATLPTDDMPLLKRLAQEEYADRQRRIAFFDKDLFGEPAWDMLLDLFIANASERRLSITALCYGSGAPQTTALRWINVLEDRGLIERRSDKQDKRRSWVSLTVKGDLAFRKYLLERARRRSRTALASKKLPTA